MPDDRRGELSVRVLIGGVVLELIVWLIVLAALRVRRWVLLAVVYGQVQLPGAEFRSIRLGFISQVHEFGLGAFLIGVLRLRASDAHDQGGTSSQRVVAISGTSETILAAWSGRGKGGRNRVTTCRG